MVWIYKSLINWCHIKMIIETINKRWRCQGSNLINVRVNAHNIRRHHILNVKVSLSIRIKYIIFQSSLLLAVHWLRIQNKWLQTWNFVIFSIFIMDQVTFMSEFLLTCVHNVLVCLFTNWLLVVVQWLLWSIVQWVYLFVL